MKINGSFGVLKNDNILLLTFLLIGVVSYIMPFCDFIQVNVLSVSLYAIILMYKKTLSINFKILALCIGILCWVFICDYINECLSVSLISYYIALCIIFLYSSSVKISVVSYSVVCSLISLVLNAIFLIDNESTDYYVAVLAMQMIAIPCSLFLIVNFYKIKKNSLSFIFSLVLLFNIVLIVVSESRAAWISIILSFAVLFIWKLLKTNGGNKQLLLLFLLLGTIIVALSIYFYFLKPDSVKGRLLIYITTLRLCLESPLIGWGSFGFFKEYMFQQKDFLEGINIYQYKELADNAYRPFNIILSIVVKYGILGFVLMTTLLGYVLNNIIKTIAVKFIFLIISCLLFFSLFSYPFEYPTTIVPLMLLSRLCLNNKNIDKTYAIPAYVKHMVATSLVIFLIFQISCEFLWYKNQKLLEGGYSTSAIENYEEIHKVLKHNPDFLYNYAAELNNLGLYTESNHVLSELSCFVNDYNTELLWGDNFSGIKDYNNAEKHFIMASEMIPNRFMPLLGLLKVYAEISAEKADSISHIIVEKPMKIPSEDAVRVKKIAHKWLNTKIL